MVLYYPTTCSSTRWKTIGDDTYYDDDGWTPELQQEIDDRLEKEEQDRQEAKEKEEYFQSLEKEIRGRHGLRV